MAMPRDRDFLIGTLSAIVGAALFGLLGPLARFGAEAGVPGVAFTAWRAILGAASLAVLIVIRGSAGSSLAAVCGLSTRGRLSLATAAVMGVALNVSMFTAFGLVPIALALMLFYTYPAGVVVADVLLGHERITRTRVAWRSREGWSVTGAQATSARKARSVPMNHSGRSRLGRWAVGTSTRRACRAVVARTSAARATPGAGRSSITPVMCSRYSLVARISVMGAISSGTSRTACWIRSSRLASLEGVSSSVISWPVCAALRPSELTALA